MLPGFQPPNWTEPLSPEERIAQTPSDGTLRGLFFQNVVDELLARGKPAPGPAHYSGFARYPLRDYMQLVVAAARELYPSEPLRAALRAVGRSVYPAFKNTMAGAAIFAFAGNDFGKVAGLAQKAYSVAVNPGEVSIREHGRRHLVVELRQVYNFPDCLQIGIWEGAMTACGIDGKLYCKLRSNCDVDLEIDWR